MPSAEHQVMFGRPVADVFAFVADGLNAPRWRPGGRRIDADYEVTAYEPNRRLAFRAIAGPVRPVGEYRYEEVGGGSRLTFSLQAELSGLKKLLMGGAVQRTMEAEVAATERLKELLEAPSGG